MGDETMSQLAKRFRINANLMVKQKRQLLESSAEPLASDKALSPDCELEITGLQAKTGEIM
jgi:hypothetical protein